MRWASWARVVILALVIVLSVAVLAPAAKKLSDSSSKCGSGFVELAKMCCHRQPAEDPGSTTIRYAMLSVVFKISSYVWNILTAIQVISHSTSAYWDTRLFSPLVEGTMVLPVATVVSVWMDVANSSMSRSKNKMKRTKKVLQLGTFSYEILLLLMSAVGHDDVVKLVRMATIGLGLTACGSVAAKLCQTLRALSKSSASLADNIFKVSRSMGIALYFMFIGEAMLLASRTRKGDTTNFALVGMTVSSLARWFLDKAILEYMLESTCAKRARLACSKSLVPMQMTILRPVIRSVASVRSALKSATAKRIAIDERNGATSPASESAENNRSPSSIPPKDTSAVDTPPRPSSRCQQAGETDIHGCLHEADPV